jgi:hypothetical protein
MAQASHSADGFAKANDGSDFDLKTLWELRLSTWSRRSDCSRKLGIVFHVVEGWERISGPLPPERGAVGPPSKSHRTMVKAMLWIVRTRAVGVHPLRAGKSAACGSTLLMNSRANTTRRRT